VHASAAAACMRLFRCGLLCLQVGESAANHLYASGAGHIGSGLAAPPHGQGGGCCVQILRSIDARSAQLDRGQPLPALHYKKGRPVDHSILTACAAPLSLRCHQHAALPAAFYLQRHTFLHSALAAAASPTGERALAASLLTQVQLQHSICMPPSQRCGGRPSMPARRCRYIYQIRRAKHYIYIESQYFMGSSFMWRHDHRSSCHHIIPAEIVAKIVCKIRRGERFCVYIVIPLHPQGPPVRQRCDTCSHCRRAEQARRIAGTRKWRVSIRRLVACQLRCSCRACSRRRASNSRVQSDSSVTGDSGGAVRRQAMLARHCSATRGTLWSACTARSHRLCRRRVTPAARTPGHPRHVLQLALQEHPQHALCVALPGFCGMCPVHEVVASALCCSGWERFRPVQEYLLLRTFTCMHLMRVRVQDYLLFLTLGRRESESVRPALSSAGSSTADALSEVANEAAAVPPQLEATPSLRATSSSSLGPAPPVAVRLQQAASGRLAKLNALVDARLSAQPPEKALPDKLPDKDKDVKETPRDASYAEKACCSCMPCCNVAALVPAAALSSAL
jgi:hypothetical protein